MVTRKVRRFLKVNLKKVSLTYLDKKEEMSYSFDLTSLQKEDDRIGFYINGPSISLFDLFSMVLLVTALFPGMPPIMSQDVVRVDRRLL